IVKPEVAIGKEQNPDVRLLMHFQGKGSLRSWPGFAASSTMPRASRRGTVILTWPLCHSSSRPWPGQFPSLLQ
ncbi:MAG: hypothetical protein QGG53_35200, partial [Planctomycetota bacterium]|nr:hypothetical protein [Planctomycetota bacterium]